MFRRVAALRTFFAGHYAMLIADTRRLITLDVSRLIRRSILPCHDITLLPDADAAAAAAPCCFFTLPILLMPAADAALLARHIAMLLRYADDC